MLSAFEADYRIHAYSYTASSFNSFSSSDLDKFVNTTCGAVEQLYALHSQSAPQSIDTSAAVAAIADTQHFNLLEKIQRNCKPIHIPQSVLDTLASFSAPANLTVNENTSNTDTASIHVPDVSSIGDYSSLLEEATRVFPDWSTERICIISPSELHKHLSDVVVVQQEIASDSSATERQTRHIGLFATKSIPTNTLIAEITGTLTTPAQLNTLSRPSKVSQQWIYETRFQSQRHPLFDAPLHHQSNQQSGQSLLESPGYATRTNLVECVPTNPSSDPFEISHSARVNPPFVFAHPARKLRFMDAPLLVDSREDGCESPGRYARSYCAGDDAQRINSCNGVLRSVLVSSCAPSAEPETMDQLLLCAKESRLRLCIFTTRDVFPGEEIVLWRGDPASVQYPCICDVDAEECLVAMGVEAFEAAGLKVLEEERKKQVEEEERMDVGGMSPAVVESEGALVTKEAPKNVDVHEMQVSNKSNSELNGGMPDIVDAMDVDTDVTAAIVEPSSPAKDVPKRDLSAVSIFKDPDAAAKFFMPSATPGGKKAWLKAHFEEARKTSEAEAAVKRAKKEDTVGAGEPASMEIDSPAPPVSGETEPITATEPPLKTKLTLKDFMNKRMQSSTSLGAGVADGVAVDALAPSVTPVPADVEEQSLMQSQIPPIVNTSTSTLESGKPDVKITNTSAPLKSDPVKPDVNTQSTVHSQVPTQPAKPMESVQSSTPSAQPPQNDPIRRPSQPIQSNPPSRPTFHADNAHSSSHIQSSREHQQQQSASHNVSQQSQHAVQTSIQSFRERPVSVSNPNSRRTSGMDRDTLDFNPQQPQHRGSMDYSSSPVGGRFSPPSLPMNDGQRAGTGFAGREVSSMPKTAPTNPGGGGGGVPMSSGGGGSGNGGRITPPHADNSLLSTSAEYRFRDRDVGFSGRSAYLSSGGSLLSAGSRIRGIGLDGSASTSSAAVAASTTGGVSGAPAGSGGGAFSMLRNRSFSGDASNPGGAGFPRERERLDAGIAGSGGIAGRLSGEREGGRSSLLGSGGAAALGDRFKSDEVAGVGGDFSMRDRGMEHRVGAGRGSEKLPRDGYASSREAREYGGYNEFDSRYSAGAGGTGSSYAPSESSGSRGVGGFGGGGSLLKGSDGGAGRGQPFLSLRPKSPPSGYYPPMDRNEEALRNYDSFGNNWNRYRGSGAPNDMPIRDSGSSYRGSRGPMDRSDRMNSGGGFTGDRGYRTTSGGGGSGGSSSGGGGGGGAFRDFSNAAGSGRGNDFARMDRTVNSAPGGVRGRSGPRDGGEGGEAGAEWDQTGKSRRSSGGGAGDYRLPPPPPPPGQR
ncbi:hypothetical protein HDU78_003109 [Chytriomyces hyalinus]|nr:hypothetical protein HDU78_003109 [Chytriomyces hyalinus]